ncbi:thermonuclease family protein [Leptolyngbya sp. AN03gr2]|uniref:thermonuclease family protein n=1 Tax=Leptolyngbya sp. AN03gr2 TaxID=3423364 RepID=UPI003D31B1D4
MPENEVRTFRDYQTEYKDPRNVLGRVLRVYDGDTVSVETQEGKRTLRFAHIDAPEKAQRFGQEAQSRLSELTPVGSTISFYEIERDQYGRSVSEIYTPETYVNLQLVSEGKAHAYDFQGKLSQYYQSFDYSVASQQAFRQGLNASRDSLTPESFRRGGHEKPAAFKAIRYESGEFSFLYKSYHSRFGGAVPREQATGIVSKPLLPTQLGAAFYDRSIGKSLPGYHSYEETYQAITGENAPTEAILFDRAVSSPSIGHRLNRLLGFKAYTEGQGIFGSLVSLVGRTLDHFTGQTAYLSDTDQRSGKFTGGPARFVALTNEDRDSDSGLFEKILTASANTLTGVSVAVFGYGATLLTQYASSMLLSQGLEHLYRLEDQRTPLQQMMRGQYLTQGVRTVDDLAQNIQQESLKSQRPVSFAEAFRQANLQVFPVKGKTAPGVQLNSLLTFTGFQSGFRRFEASNIEKLGGSLINIVVPVDNRSEAKQALAQLVTSLREPIRFNWDTLEVENVGAARIRSVARATDKLSESIPANLLHWVPQIREFSNVKDVGNQSLAEIYGEGFLTQAIDRFTTTVALGSKILSQPTETLDLVSTLYKDSQSLYDSEYQLAEHLRRSQHRQTLNQDLDQFLNRQHAGYQTYVEKVGRLNQNIARYSGADTQLSAGDKAQKRTTGSKAVLLVGATLAADYLFDQFVLKNQGASLHDQLRLFSSVQKEDGSVIRFQFNGTMPVATTLASAAFFGSASGYLFPKIETIAPRKTAFGSRIAQAVSDSDLLNPSKLESIPYSRRVRFNWQTAAIGAALGLISTKVLYTGIAAGLNALFNREPGAQIEPERDLTSGLILRALNRNPLNESSTRQDLANREVLKSFVEGLRTSSLDTQNARSFYSIAQQLNLGFIQFATLVRTDPRTGLGTMSFGLQVLPTLGIGVSPTLPIGFKMRPKPELQGSQVNAFLRSFGVQENEFLSATLLKAKEATETLSGFLLLDGFGYDPNSTIERTVFALGAAGAVRSATRSVIQNLQTAAPGSSRSKLLSLLDRELGEARPMMRLASTSVSILESFGRTTTGISFALPATMGRGINQFFEGTFSQKLFQHRARSLVKKASGLRRGFLPYYLAALTTMAMTDPDVGLGSRSEDNMFADPLTRFLSVGTTTALYGKLIDQTGALQNSEQLAARSRTLLLDLVVPGAERYRTILRDSGSGVLQRGAARVGLIAGALFSASMAAKTISRITGQLAGESGVEALYQILPGLRLASGIKSSEYNEQRGQQRNVALDLVSDVFEMITLGNVKLTRALGLYKDDPNLFLPGFGFPFGVSFREDGSTRTYSQIASPSADLSYSVFSLFRPTVARDTSLQLQALQKVNPRYLESPQSTDIMYALARGATSRTKPMQISDFTGYEVAALGSADLQRAFSRLTFKLTNLRYQRPSELMMDLSQEGVKTGRQSIRHTRRNLFYEGYNSLSSLDLTFLPFFRPRAKAQKEIYAYLDQQLRGKTQQIYSTSPIDQARDIVSAFGAEGIPSGTSTILGSIATVATVGTGFASLLTSLQLVAGLDAALRPGSVQQSELSRQNLAERASRFSRAFTYKSVEDATGAYLIQTSQSGRISTGRIDVDSGLDSVVFSRLIQSRMQRLGSTISSYLNQPALKLTTRMSGLEVNIFDALIQNQITPDQAKIALKESYQKALSPALRTQIAGKSLFERLFFAGYQTKGGLSGVAADTQIYPFLDSVISPSRYNLVIEKLGSLRRSGETNPLYLREALNQTRASIELDLYQNQLSKATPFKVPLEVQEELDRLSNQTLDLTRVSVPRSSVYRSGVSILRGASTLLAQYQYAGRASYGIAESLSYLMSDRAFHRQTGARQFVKQVSYEAAAIGSAKLVSSVLRTNPLISLAVSALGLTALTQFVDQSDFARPIKHLESFLGNSAASVVERVSTVLSPLTSGLGQLLRSSIFEPIGQAIYSTYNQAAQKSMGAMMLAEFFLPDSLFKTGEQFSTKRTVAGVEPLIYGDATSFYRQQNLQGLTATQSLNTGISSEILNPFLQGRTTGSKEVQTRGALFNLSLSGRNSASPVVGFSPQSMMTLSGTMRLALERRQELYAYARYGAAVRDPKQEGSRDVSNLVSLGISLSQRKSQDLQISISQLLSGELSTLRALLRPGGSDYLKLQQTFPNQFVFGARPLQPIRSLYQQIRDRSLFVSYADNQSRKGFGQLQFLLQSVQKQTKSLLGSASVQPVATAFHLRSALHTPRRLQNRLVSPIVSGLFGGLSEIKRDLGFGFNQLIGELAPTPARVLVQTGALIGSGIQSSVENLTRIGRKFTKPATIPDRPEILPEEIYLKRAGVDNPLALYERLPKTDIRAAKAVLKRTTRSLTRQLSQASPFLIEVGTLLSGWGRLNQIEIERSTGSQVSRAYREQSSTALGVLAGSLAVLAGIPLLPAIALSFAAGYLGDQFGRDLAIRDLLRREDSGRENLQVLTGVSLAASFVSHLHSRRRLSINQLEKTKSGYQVKLGTQTKQDIRLQPRESLRYQAAQFEAIRYGSLSRSTREIPLIGEGSIRSRVQTNTLNLLDRLAQRSAQRTLSSLDSLESSLFTQSDYQRVYESNLRSAYRAYRSQARLYGENRAREILNRVDRNQSKGLFEGRMDGDRFKGIFDRLGANARMPQVFSETSEDLPTTVQPQKMYSSDTLQFDSNLNPLLERVNVRLNSTTEKIRNHAESGADLYRHYVRQSQKHSKLYRLGRTRLTQTELQSKQFAESIELPKSKPTLLGGVLSAAMRLVQPFTPDSVRTPLGALADFYSGRSAARQLDPVLARKAEIAVSVSRLIKQNYVSPETSLAVGHDLFATVGGFNFQVDEKNSLIHLSDVYDWNNESFTRFHTPGKLGARVVSLFDRFPKMSQLSGFKKVQGGYQFSRGKNYLFGIRKPTAANTEDIHLGHAVHTEIGGRSYVQHHSFDLKKEAQLQKLILEADKNWIKSESATNSMGNQPKLRDYIEGRIDASGKPISNISGKLNARLGLYTLLGSAFSAALFSQMGSFFSNESERKPQSALTGGLIGLGMGLIGSALAAPTILSIKPESRRGKPKPFVTIGYESSHFDPKTATLHLNALHVQSAAQQELRGLFTIGHEYRHYQQYKRFQASPARVPFNTNQLPMKLGQSSISLRRQFRTELKELGFARRDIETQLRVLSDLSERSATQTRRGFEQSGLVLNQAQHHYLFDLELEANIQQVRRLSTISAQQRLRFEGQAVRKGSISNERRAQGYRSTFQMLGEIHAQKVMSQPGQVLYSPDAGVNQISRSTRILQNLDQVGVLTNLYSALDIGFAKSNLSLFGSGMSRSRRREIAEEITRNEEALIQGSLFSLTGAAIGLSSQSRMLSFGFGFLMSGLGIDFTFGALDKQNEERARQAERYGMMSPGISTGALLRLSSNESAESMVQFLTQSQSQLSQINLSRFQLPNVTFPKLNLSGFKSPSGLGRFFDETVGKTIEKGVIAFQRFLLEAAEEGEDFVRPFRKPMKNVAETMSNTSWVQPLLKSIGRFTTKTANAVGFGGSYVQAAGLMVDHYADRVLDKLDISRRVESFVGSVFNPLSETPYSTVAGLEAKAAEQVSESLTGLPGKARSYKKLSRIAGSVGTMGLASAGFYLLGDTFDSKNQKQPSLIGTGLALIGGGLLTHTAFARKPLLSKTLLRETSRYGLFAGLGAVSGKFIDADDSSGGTLLGTAAGLGFAYFTQNKTNLNLQQQFIDAASKRGYGREAVQANRFVQSRGGFLSTLMRGVSYLTTGAELATSLYGALTLPESDTRRRREQAKILTESIYTGVGSFAGLRLFRGDLKSAAASIVLGGLFGQIGRLRGENNQKNSGALIALEGSAVAAGTLYGTEVLRQSGFEARSSTYVKSVISKGLTRFGLTTPKMFSPNASFVQGAAEVLPDSTPTGTLSSWMGRLGRLNEIGGKLGFAFGLGMNSFNYAQSAFALIQDPSMAGSGARRNQLAQQNKSFYNVSSTLSAMIALGKISGRGIGGAIASMALPFFAGLAGGELGAAIGQQQAEDEYSNLDSLVASSSTLSKQMLYASEFDRAGSAYVRLTRKAFSPNVFRLHYLRSYKKSRRFNQRLGQQLSAFPKLVADKLGAYQQQIQSGFGRGFTSFTSNRSLGKLVNIEINTSGLIQKIYQGARNLAGSVSGLPAYLQKRFRGGGKLKQLVSSGLRLLSSLEVPQLRLPRLNIKGVDLSNLIEGGQTIIRGASSLLSRGLQFSARFGQSLLQRIIQPLSIGVVFLVHHAQKLEFSLQFNAPGFLRSARHGLSAFASRAETGVHQIARRSLEVSTRLLDSSANVARRFAGATRFIASEISAYAQEELFPQIRKTTNQIQNFFQTPLALSRGLRSFGRAAGAGLRNATNFLLQILPQSTFLYQGGLFNTLKETTQQGLQFIQRQVRSYQRLVSNTFKSVLDSASERLPVQFQSYRGLLTNTAREVVGLLGQKVGSYGGMILNSTREVLTQQLSRIDLKSLPRLERLRNFGMTRLHSIPVPSILKSYTGMVLNGVAEILNQTRKRVGNQLSSYTGSALNNLRATLSSAKQALPIYGRYYAGAAVNTVKEIGSKLKRPLKLAGGGLIAGALGGFTAYEGVQEIRRGNVVEGSVGVGVGALTTASVGLSLAKKTRALGGRLIRAVDYLQGGYDLVAGASDLAQTEIKGGASFERMQSSYGRMGSGAGRIAGATVGTVVGASLMKTGLGMIAGGLGTAATGVGAIPGLLTAAAGVGVLAVGGLTWLFGGEVGSFVGSQIGRLTGAVRYGMRNQNEAKTNIGNFFDDALRALTGRKRAVRSGVVFTSSLFEAPAVAAEVSPTLFKRENGEARSISSYVTGSRSISTGRYARSEMIAGRRRINSAVEGTSEDFERARRSRLLVNDTSEKVRVRLIRRRREAAEAAAKAAEENSFGSESRPKTGAEVLAEVMGYQGLSDSGSGSYETPNVGSGARVEMFRTRRKNKDGLEDLILKVFGKDGKLLSQHTVYSGLRGTQHLFGGANRTQAGSHAPVEYGRYRIESAVSAYDDSRMKSNFIGLTPTFSTRRSGIGFHLDGNKDTAPGTAGCISWANYDDYKRFEASLKQSGARDFFFSDANIRASQRKEQKREAQTQSLTVQYGRGSIERGGSIKRGADSYVVAVLAILESPTRQGRLDVTQVVANRVANNYDGRGRTIRDQAFASGQFQPFFSRAQGGYGIGRNEIQDKESAIRALQKAGFSRAQAEQHITHYFSDVANPVMRRESESKVRNLANFKGTTQYRHMRPGDFLRQQGENFYHPEPGQQHYKASTIASLFGNSTSNRPSNFKAEGQATFSYNVGGLVQGLNLPDIQSRTGRTYDITKPLDEKTFVLDIQRVFKEQHGITLSKDQLAGLRQSVGQHNRITSRGYVINYPEVEPMMAGDSSGSEEGFGIGAQSGGAGRNSDRTKRKTRFQGIIVTAARDGSGEPGLDYVVSDGRRGAAFGSLTEGVVIKTVTNQNWESRLEAGGTRRGYGNQIIVRTKASDGSYVDVLYAHADRVHVKVGDRIEVGTVLGTQGRTGSTTGAHVSVDFYGKDVAYPTRASLNMRDEIARELLRGGHNLNRRIKSGAPKRQASADVPKVALVQQPVKERTQTPAVSIPASEIAILQDPEIQKLVTASNQIHAMVASIEQVDPPRVRTAQIQITGTTKYVSTRAHADTTGGTIHPTNRKREAAVTVEPGSIHITAARVVSDGDNNRRSNLGYSDVSCNSCTQGWSREQIKLA